MEALGPENGKKCPGPGLQTLRSGPTNLTQKRSALLVSLPLFQLQAAPRFTRPLFSTRYCSGRCFYCIIVKLDSLVDASLFVLIFAVQMYARFVLACANLLAPCLRVGLRFGCRSLCGLCRGGGKGSFLENSTASEATTSKTTRQAGRHARKLYFRVHAYLC